MIRIHVQFVTAIFQSQAAIESLWPTLIPVATHLRLAMETGRQKALWLVQWLSSPIARRKYARLEFVGRIVEILLLVALALLSSTIDWLSAATTQTPTGEPQTA